MSMSRLEVYNRLYDAQLYGLLGTGTDEDRASRVANKWCVKNTWDIYNKILKENKEK